MNNSVQALIGIEGRLYAVRKRAGVMSAISLRYFFFGGFDHIRTIHGSDAGKSHYLCGGEKSLVGDGAAGLGNHLPGMSYISDARGSNVDV